MPYNAKSGSGGGSFHKDVAKFVAQAKDKSDDFVREFSQDMGQFMIVGNNAEFHGTPVDTGFARRSWWANLNSPGSHPNQPKEGDGDKGAATFASIAMTLSKAKVGDIIYYCNNAAYIKKLEYEHKSMSGFVRSTLAAADRIAEDVLRRINA